MSEKLTPRFRPSDHDIRSVDAMCVNESELSHPWWYNFKYSVAGILFGIVLVKAEIVPGSEYRKCSGCSPSTCMESSELLLLSGYYQLR